MSPAGDAPLWLISMVPFWFPADRRGMDPPKEPLPDKDGPPSKLPRLEEARRVIAEYVADLRGIIKKLRGRLN